MSNAFTPYTLGRYTLANRIVMAPMTRSRAHGSGGVPNELMARYYGQRASAGLIVSEGTQPSAIGQGYPNTPGLYTAEQIAGWRTVTDAVHAKGGVIFAQLMHAGRIGHTSVHADGSLPVAPSEVAAKGQVYTPEGMQPFQTPHALTSDEVAATIADYATAATNAIAAGFDGVELHGANGYLIHQFLSSNVNLRTDEWGGSVQGRVRFALEVAAAVADAIGPDRVGIRLSPGNTTNDIHEDDPAPVYAALVDGLAGLDLLYVHLMEVQGMRPITEGVRKQWPGTLILSPATHPEPTGPDQLALLDDGTTDLVAYGAMFIANPDLPARLAVGGPYNALDRSTAYSGGDQGYVDYPELAG
jgi:N-ethylmaleimide reductase